MEKDVISSGFNELDETALEDLLVPNMEEEIIKLQRELAQLIPENESEPFCVLLKKFFDLPPKTSARQAETATGIRRARIQKIMDGKVEATDVEVEKLTSFVEAERSRISQQRLARLNSTAYKEGDVY